MKIEANEKEITVKLIMSNKKEYNISFFDVFGLKSEFFDVNSRKITEWNTIEGDYVVINSDFISSIEVIKNEENI